MKAGQSGCCLDWEFDFSSITWLVQLTRMGLLAGFLDISKSFLGIAAGLDLASPCSDQELISVVGSSIGYVLEKSAR